MEKNTCTLVEKIGGVTYIVVGKKSDSANQNADEFIKNLITRDCMALEEECA